MQKQFAAIYARYSTDRQSDTSLEDQVRNCTRIAEAAGYTTAPDLIFTDAAVSGTAGALEKRVGYLAMLRAWEEGRFQALVCDELSRLARSLAETGRLEERIERSGVRLMTADGLDSRTPQWQLLVGITGAIAAHFVRETRHRVVRGMQGQLERGYEIAAPAFGYDLHREVGPEGVRVGTRWTVNETEAAKVREMFKMRSDGQSYAAIAAHLNASGIAPPRRGRAGKGYWRPATVFQLLSHRIYRGVFVANGSGFAKAKAKKEHRTIREVEYARPHLRLVDDETWYACNRRGKGSIRGGRTNLLSGLLSCGHCDSALSVVSGPSSQVYCASCQLAVRVGAQPTWFRYVSANAVRQVLRAVLGKLLAGAALSAFKTRLRERLEGRDPGAVEALEAKRGACVRACERIARALREVDADDNILTGEYNVARSRLREVELEIARTKAELSKEAKAAIDAQIQVDPLCIVEQILESPPDVGAAQVVLARLFPRIALVDRPRRFESVWDVEFAPGVALAYAAGNDVVENAVEGVRLRVTCSNQRPTPWKVVEV